MFLLIRHNMPWANKVFDVNVALMGIAETVEEAKSHVTSEVDDYRTMYGEPELEEFPEWDENDKGVYTLLHDQMENAYDIIPASMGFPDKYVHLAGA